TTASSTAPIDLSDDDIGESDNRGIGESDNREIGEATPDTQIPRFPDIDSPIFRYPDSSIQWFTNAPLRVHLPDVRPPLRNAGDGQSPAGMPQVRGPFARQAVVGLRRLGQVGPERRAGDWRLRYLRRSPRTRRLQPQLTPERRVPMIMRGYR